MKNADGTKKAEMNVPTKKEKRGGRLLDAFSIVAVFVIIAGALLAMHALTAVTTIESAEDDGQGTVENVTPPDGGEQAPVQPPTVGEWRDVADDSALQALLKNDADYLCAAKQSGLSPEDHFVITLQNEDGSPAANRRVTLCDKRGNDCFTGVTDRAGTVHLFYEPFGKSDAGEPTAIKVEKSGSDGKFTFPVSAENTSYTFTLSDTKEQARRLDAMLLCDTTSSMEDELAYLKAEITSVLQDTTEAYAEWTIRFSVCFFRDEGDAYIFKANPFTTELIETIRLLEGEETSGGGDLTEAVDIALRDGLNRVFGDGDADVKLLFLCTDAQNHDTDAARKNMKKSVEAAAKQGVRMIGIAGNDADKKAECMLRTLGALTGGSCVWLKDGEEQAVGEGMENKLRTLLFEIMTRYMGQSEQ